MRTFKFYSIAVLLVTSAFADASLLYAQQRMFISSGSIQIRGSRPGGVRIVAQCIDGSRPAPSPQDRYRGASPSIKISRLQNGKPVETKPLSEALGDWVDVVGEEATESLIIKPRTKDDYQLDVAEGGGVFGPSQRDVEDALATIRATAGATFRSIDTFDQQIAAAFGPSSREVLRWTAQFKQDTLWDAVEPPAERAASFDSFLQNCKDSLGSPQDALTTLSILAGRTLTPQEITAAAAAFRTEIASEYPAGFPSALADFASARSEFVKAYGTDNDVAQASLYETAAEHRSTSELADVASSLRAARTVLAQLSARENVLASALGTDSTVLESVRSGREEFVEGASSYDGSMQAEDVLRNSLKLLPGREPVSITLRHGRALSEIQLKSISDVFGRPTPGSATRTDLARYFAARDFLRSSFESDQRIARAYEATVYDGYSSSGDLAAARASASDRIFPPLYCALKDSGDYLALGLGHRITPQIAEEIRKQFGKQLSPSSRETDSTVILSARLGSLVAETTNGRKVLDLEAADENEAKAFLTGYNRILLREPLPEELTARLIPAGATVELFQDRLLQSRVASFDIDTTPFRDGNKGVSLRHFQAEANHEARTTYVDVRGLGDAIVLKVPGRDDERILIDTALSKDGYAALVRAMPPGRTKLRVAITHQDADHLAGLQRVLNDPGRFEVLQVIVGVGADEPTKPLLAETIALLEQTHRELESPDYPNMRVYVPKTAPSEIQLTPVNTPSESFTLFEVKPLPDLTYQLVQYHDPQTSNQSSLIVKVIHKGRSQLLTSDIDETVIRALIEDDFGGRFELSSDILKWPHHVSWPSEPSTTRSETMAEFLRMTNPHTILFSNRGSHQTEANHASAVKFIMDVLGRVREYWTTRDGHIGVTTDNLKTRELHFGLAA